jgi:hypothetical protein
MNEKFNQYVMDECKRQWKDNQEEIYGEWEQQRDDIKAEYYNDMYAHLSSKEV